MTEDDRTFLRGMATVLADWGFPEHGRRLRAMVPVADGTAACLHNWQPHPTLPYELCLKCPTLRPTENCERCGGPVHALADCPKELIG